MAIRHFYIICVCFISSIGLMPLAFQSHAQEATPSGESCVDHGSICLEMDETSGCLNKLGAWQCGDTIYFTDNTVMESLHGYVLLRLQNEFIFYSPTLDRIVPLDLDQRHLP